ncbi:MAG TPA: imidazolonepropionase [Kofleriaceae bacterium]|nr:imidazolonepropionase [Kofleriaceae bacterium]
MDSSLVVRNARVMTCDPARPGLGVIDRGAMAIRGGAVVWVGEDEDVPASAGAGAAAGAVIDAGGRLVTPGLVDCHTHAIFAGDRANEFGMRAAGRSYLEIAAAGGGIAATLGPTRAAADGELAGLLDERLAAARAAGTTTIEVKSGYDLTVPGELRLLRVVAAAARRGPQRIVPTLLAHLIPKERAADRARYVAELAGELVPAAAREGLAASVDVYCDEGAFTLEESRAILGAARAAGLPVRGHVGQFRDLGGAHLLAELGALSADHVEQIDDAGIAALARAGIVAVMLPGACVQLRLPVPPVEQLRRAGVPMAVASDLNPGSSFCESLLPQLWLAATHYGMTVEEAWLGVTRHAARALGLAGPGTLAAGAPADWILWRCDDPAAVPYRYGAAASLIDRVYVAGAPV